MKHEMRGGRALHGDGDGRDSYDETLVRTLPQILTWHVSMQAHAMEHRDLYSTSYL